MVRFAVVREISMHVVIAALMEVIPIVKICIGMSVNVLAVNGNIMYRAETTMHALKAHPIIRLVVFQMVKVVKTPLLHSVIMSGEYGTKKNTAQTMHVTMLTRWVHVVNHLNGNMMVCPTCIVITPRVVNVLSLGRVCPIFIQVFYVKICWDHVVTETVTSVKIK